MSKRREPMWSCGVESCKHRRAQGTAYCAEHATLESRARARGSQRTWIWIVVTGIPAIWCLFYAYELLGATCERVTFNWGGLITSAFTCVTDATAASVGFSWLAAPRGTVLGAALAIIGFTLAMTAFVTGVVIYNRSRED